jgi:hypothetical protein
MYVSQFLERLEQIDERAEARHEEVVGLLLANYHDGRTVEDAAAEWATDRDRRSE